jgi:hypothetical protein
MHTKYKSENENALRAFMKLSCSISREGEAPTVGGKLVQPCATDLSARMREDEVARKIELVLLPANTTQRRIQDSAADVLVELFRSLGLSESFKI